MMITGAVLEEMGRPGPFAESTPISVSEVELAAPGEGEVLIRVRAAGVCHSDLSVVEGNRPRPLPILLGHESSGIVEEVGPGVEGIEVGANVAMIFMPHCGECKHCAAGGKLPCIRGTESNGAGELLGGSRRLSRNGENIHHHQGVSGFATHTVVSAKSVVVIDDDIPAEIAAALSCAVLTGGGAVKNAGNPQPGDSIMVVGLGGVGMAALLVAKSLQLGEVIAVDANDSKLEQARQLGADAAYTPEDLQNQGIKADLVVEAAGHPKAFETAVEATAPGGTTVTVGLPHPDARSSIAPTGLTQEARTIKGSYLGSGVPFDDIREYAQLWKQGRLPVEQLISGRIRLEEINQAMDRLAAGEAVRQIITFD